jgi:hypothetical protein
MEQYDGIENKGVTVEEIKTNPEIMTYSNYKNINWDKYFYTKDKWWGIKFRTNVSARVNEFKKILTSNEFTNKEIVVYTHWGFITEFLNYSTKNYEFVSCEFDQDTGAVVLK